MSTAGTDDLLKVEHLSVHFPTEDGLVKSVDGIDFEVRRGEIVCIVGESGSGKSVTAQTVMGLHTGSRAQITGRVMLLDTDVVALPEDRMRRLRGEEVAMIFQNPLSSLHPFYKVGAQVAEAYKAHHPGAPRADARARALEMLKSVGIPNAESRYDDYPHQFSGGMRQRAMIAMALINDPRLLIADEPTTALDVTIQAEILRLLRDLRDRTGSAIMLITHDMGVVAEVADRVVVMRYGKVVERGTADEIFYRPQHEYTKQLLAAVPRLKITGSDAEVAAKEANEPIVSFKGATIEYPGRGRSKAFKAVTGLDLDVHPGEIVGLVGESGSGKSTIGRALIGLVPVTEGSLTVEGVDMRKPGRGELRRVRRDLGIVFQDPAASLNPRYPVGQSIAEPLALAGQNRKQAGARVEELLDAVELPRGFRNRYPHELSGGQQQRIGIARALALTPKLLVADEPTSALDVSVQARFLDLLQELQQRLGFACLFISHDLAVVDLLSDRIVVMSRGAMVEQGTADQVLRAPKEEYTRRLIAAVPVPDPHVQAERRASRTAAAV